MKILLCGAADVKRVLPQFNDLMTQMSYESRDYIDGTLGATNSNDWGENSMEAVESANIIVFILIEQAGEITWGIEYQTAFNIGKPYILLCERQLAEHYFEIRSQKGITVDESHRFYKAKNVLDLLTSHKRNIVTFDLDKGDFKKVLTIQINSELERAAKLLQIHNRNKTLLSLVKSENYKTISKEKLGEDQTDYLKKVLFDPFENKEVRKRALYYFTKHKVLKDDEIIALFEDSEQGISRLTVNDLAQLTSEESDRALIIKNLVNFLQSSDDSGMIRRAIASILETDVKIGLIELFGVFPARDIGTPRRIMEWLTENFDTYSKMVSDTEFDKKLKEMKELCKSYSKPKTIEKLVEKFDELLDQSKGKS